MRYSVLLSTLVELSGAEVLLPDSLSLDFCLPSLLLLESLCLSLPRLSSGLLPRLLLLPEPLPLSLPLRLSDLLSPMLLLPESFRASLPRRLLELLSPLLLLSESLPLSSPRRLSELLSPLPLFSDSLCLSLPRRLSLLLLARLSAAGLWWLLTCARTAGAESAAPLSLSMPPSVQASS